MASGRIIQLIKWLIIVEHMSTIVYRITENDIAWKAQRQKTSRYTCRPKNEQDAKAGFPCCDHFLHEGSGHGVPHVNLPPILMVVLHSARHHGD
jgi:hypothetical protein